MKYFLLALSVICIAISCKKVETPATKAQQLRSTKWVPNSLKMTYYTSTGGDSDYVWKWEKKKSEDPEKGNDTRPECLKDDRLEFKQVDDGVYAIGGTKCNESETDFIDFKWGLSDNDKKMYIYGLYSLLGGDANGLLTELTSDKFVFTYTGQVKDAANNDVTVKYTMTFDKN